MTGISISWVEIGAAIAALAGSIAFLFRHISSTTATRIQTYQKVVDDLHAQLAAKDEKIAELYERLSRPE